MLVYLRGTWRAEDSVKICNLLWLSRPLVIWIDLVNIEISFFPNALTSKRANKSRNEYIFFNVHVHSFRSRTAITLKFKMCLFFDEASYWAQKLSTDINLPPLMPDEHNNFGGYLGLEGDIGVYGIAVLVNFSYGISVILILNCVIAVFSESAGWGISAVLVNDIWLKRNCFPRFPILFWFDWFLIVWETVETS